MLPINNLRKQLKQLNYKLHVIGLNFPAYSKNKMYIIQVSTPDEKFLFGPYTKEVYNDHKIVCDLVADFIKDHKEFICP